jgi:hypothetical protein
MYLNGSMVFMIIFNVVFQTANSQFFVDIEHSLPRIDKKYQPFDESQPTALNRWINDIEDLSEPKIDQDRDPYYNKKLQLSHALDLIRLLSRTRGHMVPSYKKK